MNYLQNTLKGRKSCGTVPLNEAMYNVQTTKDIMCFF